MNRGGLSIDGGSLTIEDVFAVAVERRRVELAPRARKGMAKARGVVDSILERGEVVYGVTTGFGKLADVAIPHDKLRQLQLNLIRSHAAGVGELLPEAEVRAMMLLRANVLAKGYSGARPELADLLLALLNLDMHPPIPEQGSVGASGDLAPLAHLALALVGEGDLIVNGVRVPAGRALGSAGLTPAALAPKEGIALINGTQAHTGIAVLAISRARCLWRTAQVAGAMSLEGLLGTPVAFDERIQKARGHKGQIEAARILRKLLEGSELRESHRYGDPRIQDPYCLRCMPQVHGAALESLSWIESVIATELNAATDNPLIFEDGAMLSGGNFHGLPVAAALDFLAISLTHLATMSERRIDRLVNPDLNQNLPAFLARDPGLDSGFMMAQVTAAALASECKMLCHPASVDSIPTDGNKEDVVPMAMGAAWKARRVVANLQRILAIELMCAAQAIDYRAPLLPGELVRSAHDGVRAVVPSLESDRILSGDIEALAFAIGTQEFARLATE